LYALRRTRPEVVGTAGLDQHDRRNDRQTRVVLHSNDGDVVDELKAGRFSNLGATLRLDSIASMPLTHFGALSVARLALNGIERVQERLARALARGTAPRQAGYVNRPEKSTRVTHS
jgi:hypothetical protein